MFKIDARIDDPDDDQSDMPVTVEFTYHPGYRPSLYDPGEAAHVEVTSIKTDDGQEVDWLSEEQIGAVELECFNAAPRLIEEARCDAAEARYEDQRDERWLNTHRMAQASQTTLFNKKGEVNNG